jgi:hypothetical protein
MDLSFSVIFQVENCKFPVRSLFCTEECLWLDWNLWHFFQRWNGGILIGREMAANPSRMEFLAATLEMSTEV